MNSKIINYRTLAIVVTGILLGFLSILQSRSFKGVQDIVNRDRRANVFREIQILKTTNENLEDEIKNLEAQLMKLSDKQEALQSIQDEIKKDRIWAGHVDVQGQGIEVTIKKTIPVIWLTDITNELWSAGAEAVSINDIRITNSTIGFDVLPNHQLSLHGVLLNSPYRIDVIGDSKTLFDALRQPQGILQRLQESIPNIDLGLEMKEKLKMEKVF